MESKFANFVNAIKECTYGLSYILPIVRFRQGNVLPSKNLPCSSSPGNILPSSSWPWEQVALVTFCLVQVRLCNILPSNILPGSSSPWEQVALVTFCLV